MGAGTVGSFDLKRRWCGASAPIAPAVLLKDATAVDG